MPEPQADRLVAEIVGADRARRADAIAQLVDQVTDPALADAVLDRLAPLAARDALAVDAIVAAVYERRFARVAISRYLIDPGDIDDALQEVVLAVSRRIGSFRGESSLSSWVAGIARNKAIDVLRRQHPTVEIHDGDESEVARFSSQLANRADLAAAIESLSDHHRAVLIRRDLDHRSYAEIAAELDVSIGTVRSRLARARAQLARLLDEPMAQDPAQ